jgi:riboflavin kinase/FMN adenylyltransferase
MKVLCGFEERPAFRTGTAVAIGNFDGLHLGHEKILRFLTEKALTARLTSLVLTFSPHPEKILGGKQTPMIQTLEQRLKGLRASGVDVVLVANFNRAFADLSMEEFATRMIVRSLAAQMVVVGENFRFGRNRRGDIDSLRRLGREKGFSVYPRPTVIRNGQVISSSRIRDHLRGGRIRAANALLGHPYLIEGRVIKGRGLGRDLGFPTANIRTNNEIAPPGVHLTWARIQGRLFPSLTNCGSRPTFGAGPAQIETYVFDFDGALYRRQIGLYFLRRLRMEKRFPGAEALARQIRKDVIRARLYFKKPAFFPERT